MQMIEHFKGLQKVKKKKGRKEAENFKANAIFFVIHTIDFVHHVNTHQILRNCYFADSSKYSKKTAIIKKWSSEVEKKWTNKEKHTKESNNNDLWTCDGKQVKTY